MTIAAEAEVAAPADAGDRGRLTIHDRVVARIAEQAAVESGGWRERGGLLPGLGGRPLPRASAHVVGRHVRLELVVGSRLDASLPEAAARIRTAVRDRVGALTGLTVDDVDVRVTRFADATTSPEAGVLAAAPRPAGPGVARRTGLLLAALLFALGVVAIHAALVGLDVVGGPSLVDEVVERVDGLSPQDWMLPAGAALALVGVLLVAAAVWPRPRRSLELESSTGVYASRRAIEAVAVDAAGRHPGVVTSRAMARRGYVVVRIGTDGDAGIATEVATDVRSRLGRLAGSPDVRVAASRSGGER